MFPIPTTDFADINPYFFMMSIPETNLNILESWIRCMASFTSAVLPASRPLGSYTQIGNDEVLRHLSFELSPPTWHAQEIGDQLSGDSPPQNHPYPSRFAHNHWDFSQALKFCNHNRLNDPSIANQTSTLPTYPPNTWTPSLIARLADLGVLTPHPARPIDQDDYYRTTPHAVIFEPSQGSDSVAHFIIVITSGKLIETSGLTSITMLVPNPRRSLFLQNTHYSCGAIQTDLSYARYEPHRYPRHLDTDLASSSTILSEAQTVSQATSGEHSTNLFLTLGHS